MPTRYDLMPMITPAQCRAARALVDISQPQLAQLARVSESTVRNFESGRSAPLTNNLRAICEALETKGVEFINEGRPGVRVRDELTTRNQVENVTRHVEGTFASSSDERLKEIVDRTALGQIDKSLKYEIVSGNLTLLTINTEKCTVIGRVHIKPGAGDGVLRAEFRPPLTRKHNPDSKLTQFELQEFAYQCWHKPEQA
jgi:transcriptional regulator with XRE-family HTH domain